MFNGLLDLGPQLGPWGLVGATLALTHVTIVAVTVYLHRHQAHRALDLHPALAHFFRFWLWLTTGMVTREWVAIHRKHHAKCETAEDPHSPQVEGIRTVLWQGAELYRRAAGDTESMERYGQGTPEDWLERHVYGPCNFLGVSLMLIADLALFGAAGLAVWAAQMLWIPFWAAGVINGLGHYWGYRNFDSPDAATNVAPWGILIGGEELHNNHHAFASSAKFSARPWEFDLGWAYIRLFATLGLARVRKLAPRPTLGEARPQLDLEAVKALTVNRLHVLADYRRRVLSPTLRAEVDRHLGRARRSWRRLLSRPTALLSHSEQDRLGKLLAEHRTLSTVYQFKLRLQSVWKQHAASHEIRLQALREWCSQAEASGIQALGDFARHLHRYRLETI